jgi:hypothetical protein
MDNMNITKREMLHIVELLREDVVCNQRIMEEYPFEKEAKNSLDRSKTMLLKICAATLIHAYESDDTEKVAERNRLN